jgi:hypothetical protein
MPGYTRSSRQRGLTLVFHTDQQLSRPWPLPVQNNFSVYTNNFPHLEEEMWPLSDHLEIDPCRKLVSFDPDLDVPKLLPESNSVVIVAADRILTTRAD